MLKLILSLLIIFISFSAWSQNEEIIRHENLVYYNNSIKEYLQYMKENTEDAAMLDLIASMEKNNLILEEKLANVILPQEEEMPVLEDPEYTTEEPEEEELPEYDQPEDAEEEVESFGMNRFIPFKNKFNTNFEIQVGINNIRKNSIAAGVQDPDIYTPSSWYWDFAILTKNRIGGKKSKVAFSYGFSYLINRFSIDNNLRLSLVNNNPEFVVVEGAKSNPKLNIGYLTIPLALDFKLSKGFQFSIGGFVGYRVMTVQKLETKPDYERIQEQRFANYQLNNWIYGGKLSIGLKGFNIVGRYCFNNLFRDNPNYDLNTFMIGTAFRI